MNTDAISTTTHSGQEIFMQQKDNECNPLTCQLCTHSCITADELPPGLKDYPCPYKTNENSEKSVCIGCKFEFFCGQ